MAITKMIDHKGTAPSGLKQCINYCLRDDKVKQGYCAVTGPFRYDKITAENVYKSFWSEKRLWGKVNGYKQYNHAVISFHKDDSINPEMALRIGIDLCESDPMFKSHQCLICIHEDKNHLHIHICLNTVSFENGRMENHGKPELMALKAHVDKLCIENGLKVTVKGQHFDGTPMEGEIVSDSAAKYRALIDNAKESYLADCAVTVLDAIERSSTKEEFVSELGKTRWRCEWSDNRKHVVFVSDDGIRIRSSNLAKTFHLSELQTKESLEAAIENESTRADRSEADAEYEYVGTDEAVTGTDYGTIRFNSEFAGAAAAIANTSFKIGEQAVQSTIRKSNNEQKKKQRKGSHL